jgi:hypothetical protein
MNMPDHLRTAGIVLVLGLAFALVCTALVFLFLLLIDWRDTLLGAELAGLPAFFLLAVKAVAALGTAYLLSRYPHQAFRAIMVCTGYWAFLVADSVLTLQRTHIGGDRSPLIPGFFLFLSVLLLVIHVSLSRYDPEGTGTSGP